MLKTTGWALDTGQTPSYTVGEEKADIPSLTMVGCICPGLEKR